MPRWLRRTRLAPSKWTWLCLLNAKLFSHQNKISLKSSFVRRVLPWKMMFRAQLWQGLICWPRRPLRILMVGHHHRPLRQRSSTWEVSWAIKSNNRRWTMDKPENWSLHHHSNSSHNYSRLVVHPIEILWLRLWSRAKCLAKNVCQTGIDPTVLALWHLCLSLKLLLSVQTVDDNISTRTF